MTTESRNPRSIDIDLLPTAEILEIINSEDATAAQCVRKAIPEIAKVVDRVVETIQNGGRLFYVGAGTSGRLAMLDSAECPPTFSTPPEWVQAVIAGGLEAFIEAREGSEDDPAQAVADLKARRVAARDLVIGVAASGTTPYTQAALEHATSVGAKTVALVCVPDTPITQSADITILTAVGPEILAGSTRMKAGTAQKLVLNMISTAAMIRLGMTYSNWMINVRMTNQKLRDRGIRILQEILGVTAEEASRLARESGDQLKLAVLMGRAQCDRHRAGQLLASAGGNLRKALGES